MTTYVIAEAGTSHAHPDPYRRYSLAMRHVCLAAEAGADAVKFQLFIPDEPLFCPLPGDERRWERWKTTFLSLEEWRQIQQLAFKLKIDLLFSAFQHEAVDWCRQMALRYYKVASRAAKDYPYDKVPGPFIVSNGMHPTPGNLRDAWTLHCVSQYPVALENSRWPLDSLTSGLSDHSGTPWPGLDAIARNAKFLEVHFTDGDKSNDPNLTVDQLKLLCQARDGFARLDTHPRRRSESSGKAEKRGLA